jgi:dihydroorotate dehydrogenase
MIDLQSLPRYDRHQTYEWNYDHAPEPVSLETVAVPGTWKFCNLPVASPLGMPAGPLLNGRWCLYYASLGFDVVTYKTVRSCEHPCYALPNLQPVDCGLLFGGEADLPATETMSGSWAVSYGMPSRKPDDWRADIEWTRRQLPAGKILSVSVVGTIQEGWSIDDLAADYAQCARWAKESGADCVETNFSCPNVSTCDGQLFQQPADSRLVTDAVREAIGDLPYIAKIGRIQDRGDAEALLEALHGSVDALAMTNSIASTVVTSDGSRLFDGERRGICGTATRQASVEQTAMLAELIKQRQYQLELIGVGGVTCWEDVQSYLQAGAMAVHIATAAMVSPAVGWEIRQQMNSQD